MSATMPYIGSKISLITMSELRYEGILVNVNTVNSTVTLRDVRMFGTESRSAQSYVMPSPEVFDYIVFNGKDIKDLTVCEPSSLPLKEDPAVVSINVPPSSHTTGGGGGGFGMSPNRQRGMFGNNNNNNYNEDNNNNRSMGYRRNDDNYNNYRQSRPQYQNNRNNMSLGQNGPQGRMNANMGGGRMGHMPQGYGSSQGRPQGGYNNYNNNRNRMTRGGVVGELHAQPNSSLTTQVAEAFDFQEQNEKFDKSNLPAEATGDQHVASVKYDKTTSFFDHISCETLDKKDGRSSRVDRTEQRKVDQETFGVAAAMTRGPRYYKRGYRRGPMNGGSGRGGMGRRENY